MSFDLLVFPVVKAMSDRSAVRHIRRLFELDGDPEATPHPGLTAFLADFRGRYRDLDGLDASEVEELQIPVVVEAYPTHAVLSIVWSRVSEVAPFALELAERHGLALFDPQVQVVHLPPALGPRRPTDWGAAQDQGTAMLDAVTSSAIATPLTGNADVDREALTRGLLASGLRMTDLFGDEITPDNVAEILAHPPGLPARLQGAHQRARLFAELAHANPMKRSMAALRASAWAPDPEITAALRHLLAKDPDIGVRSMAAMSLGKLGDRASFEPIIRLVADLTVQADQPAFDAALSAGRGMISLALLVRGSATDVARAALESLASKSAAVGSQHRREFERMRAEMSGGAAPADPVGNVSR